jgi:hypothetical protein
LKKIERNYLICSVLLFFGFLFFWADWEYDFVGGHFGSQMTEMIFIVLSFLFVLPGIALTLEARKNKPVFWKLLGATLMACSYIYLLILGTGNYLVR